MSFFGINSPLRVTCIDNPVQMDDMVSKEDKELLERFFSRYGRDDFHDKRKDLERLDLYLDIPLVQVYFNPCYEALCRVLVVTHDPGLFRDSCFEKLCTEETLLEAIKEGNMKVVELMWDLGYAFDTTTFYFTALNTKQEAIAEYLLEHDSPLEFSVLIKTIEVGYLKCVQIIHKRDTGLFGHNALWMAVKHNQLHIMDFLCDMEIEIELDCYLVAVKNNNLEALQRLCSWRQVSEYGLTVLQNEAIEYGHVPIMEYLLQFGEHYMLYTLNAAACRNDQAMVRLLYSKGSHVLCCEQFLQELMSSISCLDVLQFLHEELKERLTGEMLEAAIRYSSSVQIVQYIHKHGVELSPQLWIDMMENDQIEREWGNTREIYSFCKYLLEQSCPWPCELVEKASVFGELTMVRFAIEHGCAYSLNKCIELAKRNNHTKVVKYLEKLIPNKGTMLRKRLC